MKSLEAMQARMQSIGRERYQLHSRFIQALQGNHIEAAKKLAGKMDALEVESTNTKALLKETLERERGANGQFRMDKLARKLRKHSEPEWMAGVRAHVGVRAHIASLQ